MSFIGHITALRVSRVELDPPPPATPQFNMPFELGLAVALEKTRRGRHEWLVFETQPHRVWKSLSDLAGTDEYVHGGTPRSASGADQRARTKAPPANRCRTRGDLPRRERVRARNQAPSSYEV